jgi:hypothetical protein
MSVDGTPDERLVPSPCWRARAITEECGPLSTCHRASCASSTCSSCRTHSFEVASRSAGGVALACTLQVHQATGSTTVMRVPAFGALSTVILSG